MGKPVVLVTSMQLSEPAQQILRDAGLEIAFASEPTTEERSIAALAGAGLDTFAAEPPDPKHPLFALDNVICTPHVAGATQGSLLRVGAIAATNIVRHLRGDAPDPDNLVR